MPYCPIHSFVFVFLSAGIGRGTPHVSETNTGRKPWPGPANSHPRGIIPLPGDQSALRTLPRQPIQTNTRCCVQLLLLAPPPLQVRAGGVAGWRFGPPSPEELDDFQLAATCSASTPIGGPRPLPRRAGKLRELERLGVAGSGESSPGLTLLSSVPLTSRFCSGSLGEVHGVAAEARRFGGWRQGPVRCPGAVAGRAGREAMAPPASGPVWTSQVREKTEVQGVQREIRK